MDRHRAAQRGAAAAGEAGSPLPVAPLQPRALWVLGRKLMCSAPSARLPATKHSEAGLSPATGAAAAMMSLMVASLSTCAAALHCAGSVALLGG